MTIDLAAYPVPELVEPLNYVDTLAKVTEVYLSVFPVDPIEAEAQKVPSRDVMAANLKVEGNLTQKNLEAKATWHMLYVSRTNDNVRNQLITHSSGAALDNFAANYGVKRLTIEPADLTAIPPQLAVLEGDESFRARIILSMDGFTTAGPTEGYIFHALSADGDVKSVDVNSPEPGLVVVTVLANTQDGIASPVLIEKVRSALNNLDTRPLTDNVAVVPATTNVFDLEATIYLQKGPDADTVYAAAVAACRAYFESTSNLGGIVAHSGIDKALHQEGALYAVITSPPVTIVNGPTEASIVGNINITMVQ